MISLLVFFVMLVPQGASPGGQAPATTGEIRGRITDRDTGLPIAGAVISLNIGDGMESRRTIADRDGHYVFSSLAAGKYAVFIGPPQFRAKYTSTVARPYPLVLKPGEIREHVDAALARTRAITVRVVDDLGEPLAGIRVSAKMSNSRVVHSGFRGTDDRGRLRLFNLLPGRYTLCADVGPFGGAAPSQPERVLRTCYPSAASEAEAETIVLGNADLEGIEITMRRGRTYTVSGTAVDSTGAPPPPRSLISLSYFERGGSSGRGGSLDADGRFTFDNVVPGEYAVEMSIGGADRPEHRRELESAFVPIRVGSADVTDVSVQTVLTAEIAGRLVLEDPAASLPVRPGYAPIYIWARLAGDRMAGVGSTRSSFVHEDRVFYLDGLFGPRLLDIVNVPDGWYVKAIRYGGEDIADRPTEFKTNRDPSKLEVVLSNRGATISGKVVNERGEPAPGARVVVLPADLPRRRMTDLTNVRASKDGTFKVGPFRRGDYSVLALDASAELPLDDADQLAGLARKGERVSLAENEEATLDLRSVR
jgi:hypothetical protein